MPLKNNYWKIECSKHLTTIFEDKISTNFLPEKNVIGLIKILMSKYALSDKEILEQQIKVPFKKPKDYINIKRGNNKLGDKLSIIFSAQVSDISITVTLTE